VNIILFDPGELHCPEGAPPDFPSGSEGKPVLAFLPRRDERATHLLKVLHKKQGDNFTAGVLGGKPGSGRVLALNSAGIECSLTLDTEPPRRTPLRLGVGFPRPIQLRRLLRDCANLGLAAVDLVSTELGEKSYKDTNLLNDGGARAALIEGAVQARDTRLPEIAVYHSLAAWLGTIPRTPQGGILVAADNVEPHGSFSGIAFPVRNVCDQSENIQLMDIQSADDQSSIDQSDAALSVLAVGSERGWSSRERDMLEEAGFLRLSLGKRALRTETACTAAVILLMEKMGALD
jgi:RsmE family RNA methyltransferase